MFFGMREIRNVNGELCVYMRSYFVEESQSVHGSAILIKFDGAVIIQLKYKIALTIVHTLEPKTAS